MDYTRRKTRQKPLATMVIPMVMLLLILFLLPLFVLLASNKGAALSKWRSHLPPSPPKLPLVGNLHQLGWLPHRSLQNLSKKHGPLMLLQLGQAPTLIVSSAEMARHFLKEHGVTFASRTSLKAARIMLYGSRDMAFAPYGEHWRQMRKICMTHLLSTTRVQKLKAAREEEVALLMEEITRASSTCTKAVDMSEVLYSFTNDMLCRSIFGKYSREEGRSKVFRQLIEENVALLSGFNLEDYFPSFGWLGAVSGFDKRATNNFRNWEGVLEKIIEAHESRNGEADEDFVDVLLSLQKDTSAAFSLTRDLVKALLMDMFAGGTDTSYVVLEWSLAELIRTPQVLKKLRDEVRGIVSGKFMVKEEDLSEMKYLRAVIKETLRLHPPVPLLGRESIESCQIQGYDIPAQTRVVVNVWALTRDPQFWDSPEEFRPERFMDADIDYKGHDFQYIPFGSGRRMCPGMQTAVSTSQLALANLVYRFDWDLPAGIAGEDLDMTEAPGLTARMKNGLKLVPKPCFS